MSWTDPPQSVIDFRDAIIACPTTVNLILPGLTLVQRQARFHYPKADPHTGGDTFPMFVLRRQRRSVKREEAQGGTYAYGHVIAHLYYVDTAIDDGLIEQYADALCDDLPALSAADTLFITEAEAGECVEPSPAMLAGAIAGAPGETGSSYRVVSIDADWQG